MHTSPLLPREPSNHGSYHRRWIARHENGLVLWVERSQLHRAALHRCHALNDMTLIRQPRHDQIVDAWRCVELDENHLSRTEHWGHAVTRDAQCDVASGRNILRQLQPAITGLVP